MLIYFSNASQSRVSANSWLFVNDTSDRSTLLPTSNVKEKLFKFKRTVAFAFLNQYSGISTLCDEHSNLLLLSEMYFYSKSEKECYNSAIFSLLMLSVGAL